MAWEIRDSLLSTNGNVFFIWFIFVLFLLFDDCHSFPIFFIFRDFGNRGLCVLGKDVFSNLTNLQSLFPLLLTLSSIHFFLHSFPSFWSFESNSLVSIESGAFNGLNNLRILSLISLPSFITSSSISSFIFTSSISLVTTLSPPFHLMCLMVFPLCHLFSPNSSFYFTLLILFSLNYNLE